MYIEWSSPTVADCLCTGNMPGGGMFIRQGDPTVSGCTFSDNTAQKGGGMLFGNGRSTVTDCTFNGNTADLGGGIYFRAGYNTNPTTVAACTFVGNTATFGGGMYNRSGTANDTGAMITDCTFNGNMGHGMYNYFAVPTVINCTFSGTSAWAPATRAAAWPTSTSTAR